MEAVEKKLLLIFLAAALLLATVTGLSYEARLAARRATQWSLHTGDVRTSIEATSASLSAAEAQERSFLLLGQPADLQGAQSSLEAMRRSLDQLAALTADNEEQRAHMQELRGAVQALAGALQKGVAARQQRGLEGGIQETQSDATASTASRARAILQGMTAAEERLLATRTSERLRWSAWSLRGFVSLSVAGALLLLFSYLIVTRDMRLRRQMISRIRAAEERSRLLVDSIQDYGIIMLAPDGTVVTWSAGAERLEGFRASEIIGQHFSVFFPPEDVRAGKCERELEEVRRTGRTEDEGWRVRKDGSRYWANTVLAAIRDQNGKLIGYSKVMRDLTERIRSEELRSRLTQANEAVRMRDEFLSIASHELRTPLTPLSLLVQRMERTITQGEVLELSTVQRADRQVQRLLRLINELLDLSRLQGGKLQLDLGKVELGAVVTAVVEDFRGLSSGHTFELDLRRPVLVRGDRERLEQVVINLVQNAVKYSPREGVVHITVEAVRDEARVTVTDNGIGIPEDEQSQIFKRFFRARNAETRHFGGLGLGLFLSHEIVQRHGGRFEVQSAPGKGSSFSFVVPGLLPAMTGDPPSRRVLLVDDDPAILETVGEALRGAGYAVDTARNGLDALERIQAVQPDILLVDLMMPLLDGASLIERIRGERLVRQAPIVIFSADNRMSERALALQADAALSKPIDLNALESAMSRLLGTPPARLEA